MRLLLWVAVCFGQEGEAPEVEPPVPEGEAPEEESLVPEGEPPEEEPPLPLGEGWGEGPEGPVPEEEPLPIPEGEPPLPLGEGWGEGPEGLGQGLGLGLGVPQAPRPAPDTLWEFVGPPPFDPRPQPEPAVWQGPPLLAPPPPPAPEPAAEPVPAPDPAPTPVDRLAAELHDNVSGLARLLTTWTLIGLLLVFGIGVTGYLVAVRLADAAHDAGYDLDRRLIGVRVLAAAGAALWVGGFVARQLLERVPLLGLALIGVFLAGVVAVVARQAVQAVGGMVLVLGARIREGDRLTVGDVSGIVEHAGFLRLRLRRPDGSTVFVPAHALDESPVTVSSPQRTQAVRVRVGPEPAPDGPLGPERREAVRRTALLCPFRQAGSEVRLERPHGEGGPLEVVVQAWSASAAEAAEGWLRRALSGGTTEQGGSHDRERPTTEQPNAEAARRGGR